MSKSQVSRGIAMALALVVSAVFVGCSGDGDNSTEDSGAKSSDTVADSGASGDGDNGRAFNSTDEAVVEALEAATTAKKVEIDGSTITLTFDEGSVDDVTASIMCGPAEAVIADDESAVLVYPDGKIECDDRP